MTLEQNVAIPREALARFCERYRIRKLSLFGSVLRDEFGPRSDIDVLVEFEPGHAPSFFQLYDMEQEFARYADGRKVDINTQKSLSKYFRDNVLREAELLYDQNSRKDERKGKEYGQSAKAV